MSVPVRARWLLLLMLWQAVAWLTPALLQQHTDTLAHLVVHTQELEHHHHHDESLHLETDADVPAHHHASDGVQPTGLLANVVSLSTRMSRSVPSVHREQHRPSAEVEGLLRPPRALA
jgi:hypothetical protein